MVLLFGATVGKSIQRRPNNERIARTTTTSPTR
jgi:hypothetical protein